MSAEVLPQENLPTVAHTPDETCKIVVGWVKPTAGTVEISVARLEGLPSCEGQPVFLKVWYGDEEEFSSANGLLTAQVTHEHGASVFDTKLEFQQDIQEILSFEVWCADTLLGSGKVDLEDLPEVKAVYELPLQLRATPGGHKLQQESKASSSQAGEPSAEAASNSDSSPHEAGDAPGGAADGVLQQAAIKEDSAASPASELDRQVADPPPAGGEERNLESTEEGQEPGQVSHELLEVPMGHARYDNTASDEADDVARQLSHASSEIGDAEVPAQKPVKEREDEEQISESLPSEGVKNDPSTARDSAAQGETTEVFSIESQSQGDEPEDVDVDFDDAFEVEKGPAGTDEQDIYRPTQQEEPQDQDQDEISAPRTNKSESSSEADDDSLPDNRQPDINKAQVHARNGGSPRAGSISDKTPPSTGSGSPQDSSSQVTDSHNAPGKAERRADGPSGSDSPHLHGRGGVSHDGESPPAGSISDKSTPSTGSSSSQDSNAPGKEERPADGSSESDSPHQDGPGDNSEYASDEKEKEGADEAPDKQNDERSETEVRDDNIQDVAEVNASSLQDRYGDGLHSTEAPSADQAQGASDSDSSVDVEPPREDESVQDKAGPPAADEDKVETDISSGHRSVPRHRGESLQGKAPHDEQDALAHEQDTQDPPAAAAADGGNVASVSSEDHEGSQPPDSEAASDKSSGIQDKTNIGLPVPSGAANDIPPDSEEREVPVKPHVIDSSNADERYASSDDDVGNKTRAKTATDTSSEMADERKGDEGIAADGSAKSNDDIQSSGAQQHYQGSPSKSSIASSLDKPQAEYEAEPSGPTVRDEFAPPEENIAGELHAPVESLAAGYDAKEQPSDSDHEKAINPDSETSFPAHGAQAEAAAVGSSHEQSPSAPPSQSANKEFAQADGDKQVNDRSSTHPSGNNISAHDEEADNPKPESGRAGNQDADAKSDPRGFVNETDEAPAEVPEEAPLSESTATRNEIGSGDSPASPASDAASGVRDSPTPVDGPLIGNEDAERDAGSEPGAKVDEKTNEMGATEGVGEMAGKLQGKDDATYSDFSDEEEHAAPQKSESDEKHHGQQAKEETRQEPEAEDDFVVHHTPPTDANSISESGGDTLCIAPPPAAGDQETPQSHAVKEDSTGADGAVSDVLQNPQKPAVDVLLGQIGDGFRYGDVTSSSGGDAEPQRVMMEDVPQSERESLLGAHTDDQQMEFEDRAIPDLQAEPTPRQLKVEKHEAADDERSEPIEAAEGQEIVERHHSEEKVERQSEDSNPAPADVEPPKENEPLTQDRDVSQESNHERADAASTRSAKSDDNTSKQKQEPGPLDRDSSKQSLDDRDEEDDFRPQDFDDRTSHGEAADGAAKQPAADDYSDANSSEDADKQAATVVRTEEEPLTPAEREDREATVRQQTFSDVDDTGKSPKRQPNVVEEVAATDGESPPAEDSQSQPQTESQLQPQSQPAEVAGAPSSERKDVTEVTATEVPTKYEASVSWSKPSFDSSLVLHLQIHSLHTPPACQGRAVVMRVWFGEQSSFTEDNFQETSPKAAEDGVVAFDATVTLPNDSIDEDLRIEACVDGTAVARGHVLGLEDYPEKVGEKTVPLETLADPPTRAVQTKEQLEPEQSTSPPLPPAKAPSGGAGGVSPRSSWLVGASTGREPAILEEGLGAQPQPPRDGETRASQHVPVPPSPDLAGVGQNDHFSLPETPGNVLQRSVTPSKSASSLSSTDERKPLNPQPPKEQPATRPYPNFTKPSTMQSTPTEEEIAIRRVTPSQASSHQSAAAEQQEPPEQRTSGTGRYLMASAPNTPREPRSAQHEADGVSIVLHQAELLIPLSKMGTAASAEGLMTQMYYRIADSAHVQFLPGTRRAARKKLLFRQSIGLGHLDATTDITVGMTIMSSTQGAHRMAAEGHVTADAVSSAVESGLDGIWVELVPSVPPDEQRGSQKVVRDLRSSKQGLNAAIPVSEPIAKVLFQLPELSVSDQVGLAEELPEEEVVELTITRCRNLFCPGDHAKRGIKHPRTGDAAQAQVPNPYVLVKPLAPNGTPRSIHALPIIKSTRNPVWNAKVAVRKSTKVAEVVVECFSNNTSLGEARIFLKQRDGGRTAKLYPSLDDSELEPHLHNNGTSSNNSMSSAANRARNVATESLRQSAGVYLADSRSGYARPNSAKGGSHARGNTASSTVFWSESEGDLGEIEVQWTTLHNDEKEDNEKEALRKKLICSDDDDNNQSKSFVLCLNVDRARNLVPLNVDGRSCNSHVRVLVNNVEVGRSKHISSLSPQWRFDHDFPLHYRLSEVKVQVFNDLLLTPMESDGFLGEVSFEVDPGSRSSDSLEVLTSAPLQPRAASDLPIQVFPAEGLPESLPPASAGPRPLGAGCAPNSRGGQAATAGTTIPFASADLQLLNKFGSLGELFFSYSAEPASTPASHCSPSPVAATPERPQHEVLPADDTSRSLAYKTPDHRPTSTETSASSTPAQSQKDVARPLQIDVNISHIEGIKDLATYQPVWASLEVAGQRFETKPICLSQAANATLAGTFKQTTAQMLVDGRSARNLRATCSVMTSAGKHSWCTVPLGAGADYRVTPLFRRISGMQVAEGSLAIKFDCPYSNRPPEACSPVKRVYLKICKAAQLSSGDFTETCQSNIIVHQVATPSGYPASNDGAEYPAIEGVLPDGVQIPAGPASAQGDQGDAGFPSSGTTHITTKTAPGKFPVWNDVSEIVTAAKAREAHYLIVAMDRGEFLGQCTISLPNSVGEYAGWHNLMPRQGYPADERRRRFNNDTLGRIYLEYTVTETAPLGVMVSPTNWDVTAAMAAFARRNASLEDTAKKLQQKSMVVKYAVSGKGAPPPFVMKPQTGVAQGPDGGDLLHQGGGGLGSTSPRQARAAFLNEGRPIFVGTPSQPGIADSFSSKRLGGTVGALRGYSAASNAHDRTYPPPGNPKGIRGPDDPANGWETLQNTSCQVGALDHKPVDFTTFYGTDATLYTTVWDGPLLVCHGRVALATRENGRRDMILYQDYKHADNGQPTEIGRSREAVGKVTIRWKWQAGKAPRCVVSPFALVENRRDADDLGSSGSPRSGLNSPSRRNPSLPPYEFLCPTVVLGLDPDSTPVKHVPQRPSLALRQSLAPISDFDDVKPGDRLYSSKPCCALLLDREGALRSKADAGNQLVVYRAKNVADGVRRCAVILKSSATGALSCTRISPDASWCDCFVLPDVFSIDNPLVLQLIGARGNFLGEAAVPFGSGEEWLPLQSRVGGDEHEHSLMERNRGLLGSISVSYRLSASGAAPDLNQAQASVSASPTRSAASQRHRQAIVDELTGTDEDASPDAQKYCISYMVSGSTQNALSSASSSHPENARIARCKGKLYSVGGILEAGTYQKTVLQYETTSRSWKAIGGPGVEGSMPHRHGHSLVTYKQKLYVYGGFGPGGFDRRLSGLREANTQVITDGDTFGVPHEAQKKQGYHMSTWQFDPTTLAWNEFVTHGSAMDYRCGHAAVVVNNKMIVWGGWKILVQEMARPEGKIYKVIEHRRSDMAYLQLDNAAWKRVKQQGSVPSPRDGHTLTRYQLLLVLLGGCMEKTYPNGASSGEPTQPQASPRVHIEAGAESPRDARPNEEAGSDEDEDLLESPGCRQQLSRSQKSPPREPSRRMPTDPSVTALGDLYTFDLAAKTWKIVHAAGSVPSPRYGHSAVLDPAGKSLLVVGGWGNSGTVLHSVFQLHLDTWFWRKISCQRGRPPVSRLGHTVALLHSDTSAPSQHHKTESRDDLATSDKQGTLHRSTSSVAAPLFQLLVSGGLSPIVSDNYPAQHGSQYKFRSGNAQGTMLVSMSSLASAQGPRPPEEGVAKKKKAAFFEEPTPRVAKKTNEEIKTIVNRLNKNLSKRRAYTVPRRDAKQETRKLTTAEMEEAADRLYYRPLQHQKKREEVARHNAQPETKKLTDDEQQAAIERLYYKAKEEADITNHLAQEKQEHEFASQSMHDGKVTIQQQLDMNERLYYNAVNQQYHRTLSDETRKPKATLSQQDWKNTIDRLYKPQPVVKSVFETE
ncbi:hypothetical protein DIPPA_20098 [Diplonema papillatum]|nr:hypothetical protein DIPPA_20098 [Diplonema papillatum]